MIQITPQMRVLVAVEPADFRCGIDGLAQRCRVGLGSYPSGGPRSPAGHAAAVVSSAWCVLKASTIQRVRVPPRKEPERLVAGPSRRERSRLVERGVKSHYGGSKSAGRNMK
jgi:hypothetical protein